MPHEFSDNTDSINYRLVYKLRHYNTDSLKNLQVQYRNEADKKAAIEHQKYLDAIERLIGHPNFEVTNITCMADGIRGHVYAHPTGSQVVHGLGKRVCIFCNCDDMEEL